MKEQGDANAMRASAKETIYAFREHSTNLNAVLSDDSRLISNNTVVYAAVELTRRLVPLLPLWTTPSFPFPAPSSLALHIYGAQCHCYITYYEKHSLSGLASIPTVDSSVTSLIARHITTVSPFDFTRYSAPAWGPWPSMFIRRACISLIKLRRTLLLLPWHNIRGPCVYAK